MEDYKEISKIKILNKSVNISYQKHIFREENGEEKPIVNDHDIISREQPHDDFVNAMKKLRKHVIDICELHGAVNLDDIEVSGVTFSGLDDDETAKVIITCQRRLTNNKTFTINTPLTTLFDESKYSGAEDLDNKCSEIRTEAFAFLDGKVKENPQLNMFNDPNNKIEAKLVAI